MNDADFSNPSNFSWLIPEHLAGMALPWTCEEFTALQTHGVRGLVSLLKHPLPVALLERYGLSAVHIAIEDYEVPTLVQASEAVAAINRFLADGLAVAVYCVAGLGRTGTILACYLVSRGVPASEAIADLRAKRPGSIETAEQEAAVAAYAVYLRQRSKAPHPAD